MDQHIQQDQDQKLDDSYILEGDRKGRRQHQSELHQQQQNQQLQLQNQLQNQQLQNQQLQNQQLHLQNLQHQQYQHVGQFNQLPFQPHLQQPQLHLMQNIPQYQSHPPLYIKQEPDLLGLKQNFQFNAPFTGTLFLDPGQVLNRQPQHQNILGNTQAGQNMTNVHTHNPQNPQSSTTEHPGHGHSHSGSIGSSMGVNPRKRARKSDHALPGDDGDTELKVLAFKTSDVPLPELASRIKLLENEDSPGEDDLKENKERQRQLFGMVWLLNSCESSPTAVVPRNRIYARYVQVCADNNLTPLSPASFGKLVKILFPSLTTRRLGMRGQSKYHYCGIKLNGNMNQQVQSPVSSISDELNSSSPTYTPINSPCVASTTQVTDQLPLIAHLKYIPDLLNLLNSNLGSSPNNPIQLPLIYPFLPRDTDFDIADTLYLLYKVHVNSIFESLRFMQIKKLFASFNNFNSTLTAPVFKLYTSERIVEWVQQCDLIMYKRMIRMLSKLQLQFMIPADVTSQLKQISLGYVKTLSNNLLSNKVSKNFIVMKLKLAKNFINLLNRLIKIIETGQSASRILNDGSEKKSMIDDWLQLDIHEIISREMPCDDKNIQVLLYILNTDLLNILNGKPQDLMFQIGSYISELPGKFVNINPRLFILLTSNLLTTCLREISLSSGQGFGAWWIFRCWIDEFLSWVFELGGLLQEDFLEDPVGEIGEADVTGGSASEKSLVGFGSVDLLDGMYGGSGDILINFD